MSNNKFVIDILKNPESKLSYIPLSFKHPKRKEEVVILTKDYLISSDEVIKLNEKIILEEFNNFKDWKMTKEDTDLEIRNPEVFLKLIEAGFDEFEWVKKKGPDYDSHHYFIKSSMIGGLINLIICSSAASLFSESKISVHEEKFTISNPFINVFFDGIHNYLGVCVKPIDIIKNLHELKEEKDSDFEEVVDSIKDILKMSMTTNEESWNHFEILLEQLRIKHN